MIYSILSQYAYDGDIPTVAINPIITSNAVIFIEIKLTKNNFRSIKNNRMIYSSLRK